MDSQFYRKTISGTGVKEKLILLAKNKRFVLRFIAASIVGGVILFGDHGIIQRIQLSQRKSELQAKIGAAEEESKRLQAESRALDGDAKAIEKVAREKHGMIREGETVYKVTRK
jgi:cell division protein FtsB